ncbi:hypothetical protein PG996_005250 [Apiospora saccharicola]|uniref:BTB domain-containing protein n=1 Tax=Apiospora saccharicola TaxID=335842 RepID=A0ABR1VM14_9PEZI
MKGKIYKLDPNGDVVLTLRNPNAPFAVWNEDAAPDTTEPLDPWIIACGANVLPATVPAEPVIEATPEPEAELFVGAPDEPVPGIEPIAGRSISPELAEDTPIASEPVGLASMSCSPPLPPTDQSCNQADIRMRLSSRHLILASPYFKKMLLGPWRESTSVLGSSHFVIEEEGWDDDALLILMHVIHGRTRSVPRFVSLETLAKIAVLVDYYQCHEVVEFVTPIWIGRLKWSLPQEYCRDLVLWCLVSWVFSEADLFQTVTKIAVNKCKGPLPTLDLPITELVG